MIMNNTSGRCVKLDGKIGQQILQDLSSTPGAPGAPTPPATKPSPGSPQTKKPTVTAPLTPSVPPVPSTKEPTATIVAPVWFLDKPIEEYSYTKDGFYRHGDTTYVLPHNRAFPAWITDKFKQYRMTSDTAQSCAPMVGSTEKPLFQHQQFIQDYMSPEKPYRGLLLDHDLGSGKTRTAIIVAEQYRKLGVNVVIMLPATLRATWMSELKNWGQSDIRRPPNYPQMTESLKAQVDAQLDQVINRGYTFISYNASNTVQQINKAKGGGALDRFTHRLIVVDEVHNFLSMIVNPTGKKGQHLYRAMMDVTDCKFLFLSATPVLNTSFELGMLFNILKGYMNYGGTKTPLFPENKEDFENLFVDVKNGKLKEPLKFTRRIIGMVSYYFGGEGDIFPTVIKQDNPITCPFTVEQFEKYSHVRAIEMEQEKKRIQKRARRASTGIEPSGQDEDVTSTFRIFSRQVANFAFPRGIIRPYPDSLASSPELQALDPNPDLWTTEQVDQLQLLFDVPDDFQRFLQRFRQMSTPEQRLQLVQEIMSGQTEYFNAEDLFILQEPKMPPSYAEALDRALEELKRNPQNFGEGLSQLSPKMVAIYENIVKNGPLGPCFVYSQFRHMEGIAIFAQVLDHHGFKPLNPSTPINQFISGNRYVIYSGEESPELRDQIRKIFNDPRNMRGGLCRVLLGTSASAEGITLKNVRQVHIIEPYWNEVRIQQVIGRARRICSHYGLPKEDRNIHVYRYHMVMTSQQQELLGEALSTDQAIYRIAQHKEIINSQFLQLLKNAAVDCMLNFAHNNTPNNPIKCFMFDATDTGLTFEPDIKQEKMDVAFTAEREETTTYYIRVGEPLPPCYNGKESLYHKVRPHPQGGYEILFEKVKFEMLRDRETKSLDKPTTYEGLVYYQQTSPTDYIPICVKITTNRGDGHLVDQFISHSLHSFSVVP
jgi:hypothetical protein